MLSTIQETWTVSWNRKPVWAALPPKASHSQEHSLDWLVCRCVPVLGSPWAECLSAPSPRQMSSTLCRRGSRDVKAFDEARCFSSRATVSSYLKHAVCVEFSCIFHWKILFKGKQTMHREAISLEK